MLGDQKHIDELGFALINTVLACSEIIGLSCEDMEKEDENFEPHCGSAGKSVKDKIEKISWIYHSWMVPEVANALNKHRSKR